MIPPGIQEMLPAASAAPEKNRSAWIVAQRPPRVEGDPFKPHAFFTEEERAASGRIVRSAAILLTNKECPWRCLMCDLWKNTLTRAVPPGAIPRQIDHALSRLAVAQVSKPAVSPISKSAARRTSPARGVVEPFASLETCDTADLEVCATSGRPVQRFPRFATHSLLPEQIKLYNSGSFFDPAAIPLADYPAIARCVSFAQHLVVESHPRLVGEKVLAFRDLLAGSLEVALGLETVHPEVLPKLNKKFELSHFAQSAGFLRKAQITVRAFVLVKPPFLSEAEGLEWAVKSAEFAFDCGATVVSLIPTRLGNGALERLMEAGEFAPPRLATLERAQELTLDLRGGRVFADTWNLDEFSACPACLEQRRQRLHAINLRQETLPPIACPVCRRGRN
jgi:uncharacterized Fe-S cluster-containing MiaB family protein